MKLTIVAATGGVGRELLEQAVAAGHDVTAVVRNPAKLSRQVQSVTADLSGPDPAACSRRSSEPMPCSPGLARTRTPTQASRRRACPRSLRRCMPPARDAS